VTTYEAVASIEGFGPEKDELEAWATLIRSGDCWNLQGTYGRTAMALINAGHIDKAGNILWVADRD
jgi:hypothetical protein